MKKRIISFILLLTSVALLLLLSSCTQGEEKTNTVFIDKNEKYGVCEHRWEMKSKTLPTCTREGETTMECTYCHKINTVVIPTGECEYNVYFHWYNNKSRPLLHFDCTKNAAHSFYVDCSLETVKVPKTCTERGSTIKIATATYNGVTYTDTLVKDLGLAAHDYSYSYELLGSSCTDGVEETRTCNECGEVEKSVNYNHRLISTELIYSFEELGLCQGGEVTRRVCLCGEICATKYTVNDSGCETYLEENLTNDNGDTTYYSSKRICKECGYTSSFDGMYVNNDKTQGNEYAYKISKYKLTDEITWTDEEYSERAHDFSGHKVEYTYNNIDDRWYHEEIATCTQCLYKHTGERFHKMKYTYEPLGETCLDGINVNGVCLGCGYTTEYVTTSHQTASIEASYNLEDYGFCKGTINVEVCFCGYKRLTPSGLYWYSPRKTEKTEKSDTLKLIIKTEKCSGCGFAIETVEERTLIDGAWYTTNVITNIYLDEETTLTVKLPIQDPSGDLDRPLTAEEFAALEKYLEWIRRQ